MKNICLAALLSLPLLQGCQIPGGSTNESCLDFTRMTPGFYPDGLRVDGFLVTNLSGEPIFLKRQTIFTDGKEGELTGLHPGENYIYILKDDNQTTTLFSKVFFEYVSYSRNGKRAATVYDQSGKFDREFVLKNIPQFEIHYQTLVPSPGGRIRATRLAGQETLFGKFCFTEAGAIPAQPSALGSSEPVKRAAK